MSLPSLFESSVVFSNPRRLVHSTWLTHIPFGMYLVEILKPKVIVELGTYRGASYCAFCQAVQALELKVQCYAVDTWAGDLNSGYYGTEVLDELRSYHDPLYGGFSRLIQSSFDDALGVFADNSIDLLHLDGLHIYESAKADFQNWLPKVSNCGVVLLHDTNVRAVDYGVWRLFEELKATYPSFEFSHGYGLGLVAVGSNPPPLLSALVSEDAQVIACTRRFFEWAGGHVQLAYEIQSMRRVVAEREEAFSWARQLQEEEARLSRNLPFRVARALARHGFFGAIRRRLSQAQPPPGWYG